MMIVYELGRNMWHPNTWTDQPTLNESLLPVTSGWVKKNAALQHKIFPASYRADSRYHITVVAVGETQVSLIAALPHAASRPFEKPATPVSHDVNYHG